MRHLAAIPDSIIARIQNFLLQPVPPTGTRFRQAWERECLNLPDGATEVLVESLRRGTPSEQENAVVALRSRRWDVLETGEIGDRRYSLRAPGSREWQQIKPMLQLD
ncbi:MAG: hypothetical protein HUU15_12785 [Candidatus Brocadiae bacterium]|nr:hypothetical protein [Candidatus Brocadiia bacterium]